MSLISDIDEAKVLWWNASPIFKIIIAISTFLTISSVTSLSDKIFAWKGFILDAIEFYRYWVGDPINKFLQIFDLHLESNEIDTLVITSLLLFSYSRALWAGNNKTKEVSKKKIVILFSVMNVGMIAILGYCFLIKHININSFEYQLLLPSCYLYMFALPVISKFPKNEIIAFYFPIATAIIIVLVLGAVNAAHSR